MEWLTNPQAWIALVTLTALEIVLGIDNIIFISVLVSRLPHKKRNKARVLGLGLAMFTRIALLLSITWVMKLTAPLFIVLTEEISGRDVAGRRVARRSCRPVGPGESAVCPEIEGARGGIHDVKRLT